MLQNATDVENLGEVPLHFRSGVVMLGGAVKDKMRGRRMWWWRSETLHLLVGMVAKPIVKHGERERERERETFLTLQSRNRPLVPCAALVTRPV